MFFKVRKGSCYEAPMYEYIYKTKKFLNLDLLKKSPTKQFLKGFLVGPKLKIPVKGCNSKPLQWPTSKNSECECYKSICAFGPPPPHKKVKKNNPGGGGCAFARLTLLTEYVFFLHNMQYPLQKHPLLKCALFELLGTQIDPLDATQDHRN